MRVVNFIGRTSKKKGKKMKTKIETKLISPNIYNILYSKFTLRTDLLPSLRTFLLNQQLLIIYRKSACFDVVIASMILASSRSSVRMMYFLYP